MSIINATHAHMTACEAIYAHGVQHGTSSFDECPPAAGHLGEQLARMRTAGLPFLVSLAADGTVQGYAYAAPFRPRSAYRYTVENSLYLAPEAQGQGLAAPLFHALIAACRAAGMKTMIAVIGMPQDQDPAAYPSVRAHAKAGFTLIGALPNVGYKFERWMKTAYMCLDLSPDL